jgi:hypothetical protein
LNFDIFLWRYFLLRYFLHSDDKRMVKNKIKISNLVFLGEVYSFERRIYIIDSLTLIKQIDSNSLN